MRFTISVQIFLMMTWKFTGIYAPYVHEWTIGRNKRVLILYFDTLPADDGQEARMENSWSTKSPGSTKFIPKELQRRAQELIEENYRKWQERPLEKQVNLEARLSSIFETIRNPQPIDEKKIYEQLSKQHPEYCRESLLIRSVIHKRFQQKVMHSHSGIWTPLNKALLLYIDKAVRLEGGNITENIKDRWLHLRPELRGKVSILEQKLKELKYERYRPDPEVAGNARAIYRKTFTHAPDDPDPEEPKKWTTRWSENRKAELLYVYEQNKDAHGDLYRNMERRWAQMYGYPSPVGAESLMKRVRILQRENYEPVPKHTAMAKAKYSRLPPLNVPDRKGKRILIETDNRTMSTGKYSDEHQSEVPGNIAAIRVRTGKGIQISDKADLRRKVGTDVASTSRSSEQQQHNVPGYIATPRDGAGHGTQRQRLDLDLNQPYQVFDPNELHHHWEHGDSSGQ